MKGKRNGFIAVVAFFVAAAAAFCGWTYFSTEKALEQSDDFYYYTNEDEYSNTSLSADEIMSFESKYKGYSSEVYYNRLNDSEKIIYDSVIYAFENNDCCLFIPESYMPSGSYTLTDILYFVALDSPLIEQNIAFGDQSDTSEISMTDLLGIEHTKEVQGTFLYINNFTEERMNNKKLAIDKAKEIIDGMPSDITTDAEKVRYYFNALTENSKYVDYDYETLPEFLYDALVAQGSNCDGFANAFSLICNMSGIPCFEKMMNGEGEEDGHTWNCVFIDKNYYNVDVTGGVDAEEDAHSETYLFFPDAYSTYGFEYKDVLPECTDASLSGYDCAFTDENDSQIVKTLVSEFRNNQSKYVCAFFGNMSEPRAERVVDMFFNQVNCDIEYYTAEPINGNIYSIIINSV